MLGFVPYLLVHLDQIARGNAPSKKFTPTGYLNYLIREAATGDVVNIGTKNADGTFRSTKVKTRVRGSVDNVGDADNCDVDVVPNYVESDVEIGFFRKITMFLEDETIAKYESEAAALIDLPAAMANPSGWQFKTAVPTMMRDFVEMIVQQAYPLFMSIDQALIAKQAANFGYNNRTGLNTATAINISKNTNIRSLSDGFLRIVQDYQENEMVGKMAVVGNGLFHAWQLERQIKTGADQSGNNDSNWANNYDFFYDPNTVSGWGADQVGIFAPGSVGLVQYNKFKGFKAGDKLTSYDFMLQLPIVDSLGGGNLGMFLLDAQLQRIDCPTAISINGYNDPVTVDRGWKLTLSKTFDQYNVPSTAYASDDRNYRVNGTFRYEFSNDCDEC